MPDFDPNQDYETVATAEPPPKPAFDPGQPFQRVNPARTPQARSGAPRFDPTAPFTRVLSTSDVAADVAAQTGRMAGNATQAQTFEEYQQSRPTATQLTVQKLIPLAKTPQQQDLLARLITARLSPELPTSTLAGQAWQTAWTAPKPTAEYVETMQGIRQSELDSVQKSRAMLRAHGLDPDNPRYAALLPPLAERLAEGAGDALEDLALTFQSPAGALTLGMSSLPRSAQRMMSLAFAGQMLTQAPDQAQQLLEEARKPAGQRDWTKIARLAVGGAASVGFGSIAAAHGLSPIEGGVSYDTQEREQVPGGQPQGQKPGNLQQPQPGGQTTAPGGVVQTPPESPPVEGQPLRPGAVLQLPGATLPAPQPVTLDDVHQRVWDGEDQAVKAEVHAAGEAVNDGNMARLLREAKARILDREWGRTQADKGTGTKPSTTPTVPPPETPTEPPRPGPAGIQPPGGQSAEEQARLTADLELLRNVMEDQHRELAGQAIGQRRAAARRPTLGPRPDGQRDILDAINELGGVRPPGPNAGGEYDGYQEAMTGPARLLRNTASSHGPDTLLKELKSGGEYTRLETFDDLWAAIKRAADERASLPAAMAKDKAQLEQEAKRAEEQANSALRTPNSPLPPAPPPPAEPTPPNAAPTANLNVNEPGEQPQNPNIPQTVADSPTRGRVLLAGAHVADLVRTANGRWLAVPTPQGENLPPELQAQVLAAAAKFQPAADVHGGAEANLPPAQRAESRKNNNPEGWQQMRKATGATGPGSGRVESMGGRAPRLREMPTRFADRQDELDQIAKDLYGRSYDALQPDDQGAVQVTLESEDAAVQRHNAILQGRLSAEIPPGRLGAAFGGHPPAAAAARAQRPVRPAGPAPDLKLTLDLRAAWEKVRRLPRNNLARAKVHLAIANAYLRYRQDALDAMLDAIGVKMPFARQAAQAVLAKAPRDVGTGDLNLNAFKALGSSPVQSVFDYMRLQDTDAMLRQERANSSANLYPGAESRALRLMERGQRTEPGRIEAMGAKPPRRTANEQSQLASRTQEQKADTELTKAGATLNDSDWDDTAPTAPAGGLPGGPPGTVWFAKLRGAFNPMSLGDAAKETATALRYVLGKQFVKGQQFDEAMARYRALFDRRTTPRNFAYDPAKPLPPNWEIQRAVDSGETSGLTPAETTFADTMRKLFDEATTWVQQFKPDLLKELYENYFPRYWRDADQEKALRLLQGHRPWQGPKTFLKPRTLALWEDALKLGLKPRYDNPVDAAYMKLAEMWRFAAALEAHGILRDRGVRRFRYIFERAPDGWVSADPTDPSTKVFAPPTVTIKEAYDEQVRVKTLEMFKSLGIPQERLVRIGGKRWGYASENAEKVATKFAGPDFVFWHEFGHIMDFRFPDLRAALGLTLGGRGGSLADTELRKLADERLPMGDTGERARLNKKTGKMMKVRSGFSSYTRRAEEKMANVFDAYVRAPDLFKQTAPNVYSKLLRWLDRHPEVKGPLNDIRPSLKLGQGAAEQFVGGPILLGEWIMPADAAKVLQNHLSQGAWEHSQTLTGIKRVGGMMSSVRLVSLFHGQMVSNDALASGLSLPLADAMNALAQRRPDLLKRAAKDVLLAPARPFIALRQGGRILRAIRDPNAAGVSDLDRQLAGYATQANLRAGHWSAVDNSTRRWKQAIYEAANAWRSGQPGQAAAPLWTALWELPLMVSHEMMRPVMNWLVPRMKYGLVAPMLMRIVADNPSMDEWALRRKFGQAANDVEDRVGQVTYDNMFLARAVKDSGQLALQAFGWHATKERMLWGAASDYAKAGRAMLKGQRPEVTYRMAYLPSMVFTHALIGGMLMYALTRRRPRTTLDYLFPETGLVDQYGRPVRMAIADFMKDYLGEWNAAWQGPKATAQLWERRLLPVWNELADMYRDRDFWNVKIFSEKQFDEPEWQHLWNNLKEAVNYTAGANLPFSAKGAARFTRDLPANADERQKLLATVGPYFGFVPAPMALTQSPAEALAAEIMRDSLPAMTKDQMTHVKLVADLVHDLRTGKVNDEGALEARLRAAKVTDAAERTRIAKRMLWTPLQYQVSKLPLYERGGSDAMSVWGLMSTDEKHQTAPLYMEKIYRLAPAPFGNGRLDADTTRLLTRQVQPYLAAKPAPVAAAAARANRSAIAQNKATIP